MAIPQHCLTIRPKRRTIVRTQQAESLITIHNLEHPRSVTRCANAFLTLAGAAAVGVLALRATSPAANADTTPSTSSCTHC
jgi:hypothetical protein